jgi:hypothetical protein
MEVTAEGKATALLIFLSIHKVASVSAVEVVLAMVSVQSVLHCEGLLTCSCIYQRATSITPHTGDEYKTRPSE